MSNVRNKVEVRLTQTLIRLRLAKLRQIVDRTGQSLEDSLYIKKQVPRWRIDPIRPSPLKLREVTAINRAVRAVHYRGMQIYDNSDDRSE